MRNKVISTLIGGMFFAAGFLISDPVFATGKPPKCPDCECYFAVDCKDTGRGDYCDYSAADCFGGNECRCIPKPDKRINGVLICNESPGDPQCDGLCRKERRKGARWDRVTPEQVANATNLVLNAYLTVGRQGGGEPDAGILRQLRTVPKPWRKEILRAADNILFALLAGDFMPPSRCPDCKSLLGRVPRLDETAALLIDSVRIGFVEGILENNPNAVVGPIQNFWASNEFNPFHRIHCYSHGHEGAPDTVSCQTDQVQGILKVILRGRESVT